MRIPDLLEENKNERRDKEVGAPTKRIHRLCESIPDAPALEPRITGTWIGHYRSVIAYYQLFHVPSARLFYLQQRFQQRQFGEPTGYVARVAREGRPLL
jgi:hypothetical protein